MARQAVGRPSLNLRRLTRSLQRTVERDRCPYHARLVRVAEAFRATENEPFRVRRVAHATAHVLDTLPLRIRRGEILVGWHPNTAIRGRLCRSHHQACLYLRTQNYWVPASEGHCAPDYPRLLTQGLEAVRQTILTRLAAVDTLAAEGPEQQAFYQASLTSLEALQRLIQRYGDYAQQQAEQAPPAWAAELRETADICHHLALEPARTLREAIQLAWFLLLGLTLEASESHHCYIPGRMDQYLYPFFRREQELGVLDNERLQILLDQFFIKLNEFEGPAMSAMSLSVGGRTAEGKDATNELSYALLEAGDRVRMYFPGLGIHWTSDTPPELMRRGVELLRNGKGHPAFFNSDLIIQGLVRQGVAYSDAVDHLPSTCTETSIQGCSWGWVAWPYMNLPKALLHALFNGRDPLSPGSITDGPQTYDELHTALQQQIEATAHEALRQGIHDQVVAARYRPFPLLSALVRGCVESGRDITSGGATYTFLQPEAVGVPNVVDSMAAIKALVAEQQRYTLQDFRQAVHDNFSGHEALLQAIQLCPRHGQDVTWVNTLFAEVAGWWCQALAGRNHALGGPVLPGFLGWTMWIGMGQETPATPDGRRAGQPIANSFSPTGAATHGTPAMLLSTTAFDQSRGLGGITFNVRFAASALATDAGVAKLQGLLETGFDLGIFQVQVNVIGAEVLRLAQLQPESYRDLFVRIGGYLVPFTLLPPDAQEEVIQRAELPL